VSGVHLGGQKFARDAGEFRQKGNLLLFGREETVVRVCLNEVESHQARLDGLGLVLPPIAAVLVAHSFIERFVLKLEDLAIVLEGIPASMAAGQQFLGKGGCSLAPFDTDCRIELPAYEVPAVQGGHREEPGLFG